MAVILAIMESVTSSRSRHLTEGQIKRLDKFRTEQRDWNWSKVLLSMTKPPFGLKVLMRAGRGGRISEKNHAWLSAWLDRHLPDLTPQQPVLDRKSAAAGDDSLDNGETPEIAPQDEKTNRGSR